MGPRWDGLCRFRCKGLYRRLNVAVCLSQTVTASQTQCSGLLIANRTSRLLRRLNVMCTPRKLGVAVCLSQTKQIQQLMKLPHHLIPQIEQVRIMLFQ
jgi:hypothetical protein